MAPNQDDIDRSTPGATKDGAAEGYRYETFRAGVVLNDWPPSWSRPPGCSHERCRIEGVHRWA